MVNEESLSQVGGNEGHLNVESQHPASTFNRTTCILLRGSELREREWAKYNLCIRISEYKAINNMTRYDETLEITNPPASTALHHSEPASQRAASK